MTLVTGTVQDLGYDGMEGTLWARPARFRSDGSVVYAPERKPFTITGGVVSAELAPGPAVLELQVGSHARGTFEVVIPDTDITLADLLDTVFPWEPAQVSQFVAERELAVQAKTAAETAAGQASTAAGTATTAAQQTGQDRTAVAADKQVVVGHVQALAAPNDAAVLGLISEGATTQTKAALNATYGRKMLVDANQNGVTGDGTTNDAAAWQALVNSLEGTGATITWTGRSVVDTSILWKRGVSLIGQGWGRSVLATRGDGSTPFGAIEGFSPYATVAAPFEDLTFSNFEVDGSEQAVLHPGPSISGKAMFIQFMRRCQILNLYLHDTIGTALGIDFLPDCLIHGVLVVRGGKNWTGNEGGHAGIGIGMGAWEEENTTISDCHTIDCGHWGIFVERQNEQQYRSRGAKIIGCSATGTRGTGIADVGCTDTLIANCSSTGNGSANDGRWRDGFQAMYGSIGTRFINNTASHNAGDGFNVRSDNGPGITLAGNKSHTNMRRGIIVSAENKTLANYTVRDNEVFGNAFDGISVGSGATGSLPNLIVEGNRCYDNGKAGNAAAGTRGIAIAGTVSGGAIDRNRCYDDQATKTQSHGIALPSGTFTNTSLSGNNVTGNGVAGVATTGATLTSLACRGNIGYLTENKGAASILAGTDTVTVIHGLAAPPTSVQVTPRAGGDPIWVTTIGASGFVVNRAAALSGAGVDFTWTAEA